MRKHPRVVMLVNVLVLASSTSMNALLEARGVP
jgi:hypothetical protein